MINKDTDIRRLELKVKTLERENRQLKIKIKQIKRIIR
jgi:chaperonin cofactor prefoldin